MSILIIYVQFIITIAGYLEFASFLKKNEIFCILKVSNIDSCYPLTTEVIKSYNSNCPIIYLPEREEAFQSRMYGFRPDYYYPSDLKHWLLIGFSDDSSGIRIYDNTKEAFYWQKLENQAENLFKSLLIHADQDYKKYHQMRKLLPGDLRSTKAILDFIEINLINYGSKCDFYLPKELVEAILFNDDLRANSIEGHKKVLDKQNRSNDLKLFEELCAKYGIKQCRYITPSLDPSDLTFSDKLIFMDYENIDPASHSHEIRIFSGFNLSDDLYKGLYLYNRRIGAGISGDDDGWSLAISGVNLPFIDIEVWDKNLTNNLKFMSELIIKLNLTILKEYFEVFNRYSFNLFSLIDLQNIFNDPSKREFLKIEYATLVEQVKKEMNIYDKLEKKIKSIQELKNQECLDYAKVKYEI